MTKLTEHGIEHLINVTYPGEQITPGVIVAHDWAETSSSGIVISIEDDNWAKVLWSEPPPHVFIDNNKPSDFRIIPTCN